MLVCLLETPCWRRHHSLCEARELRATIDSGTSHMYFLRHLLEALARPHPSGNLQLGATVGIKAPERLRDDLPTLASIDAISVNVFAAVLHTDSSTDNYKAVTTPRIDPDSS